MAILNVVLSLVVIALLVYYGQAVLSMTIPGENVAGLKADVVTDLGVVNATVPETIVEVNNSTSTPTATAVPSVAADKAMPDGPPSGGSLPAGMKPPAGGTPPNGAPPNGALPNGALPDGTSNAMPSATPTPTPGASAATTPWGSLGLSSTGKLNTGFSMPTATKSAASTKTSFYDYISAMKASINPSTYMNST